MPGDEIIFLSYEEIDALWAACIYREHMGKTFLDSKPISPEFAKHLKTAQEKLGKKFGELSEARDKAKTEDGE